MTYADVEEFRATAEAVSFADHWLKAQRQGEVDSDYHMDLLAWASGSPVQALGIVLNLIDRVGKDKRTAEQIFLGPIGWLVEQSSDEFTPVLLEVIENHSGFDAYTGMRVFSDDPKWVRLNKKESSQTVRPSPSTLRVPWLADD